MEDVEDSEDANDAPHNDFYFTGEGFLSFRDGVNDATQHHSKYMNVWRNIK